MKKLNNQTGSAHVIIIIILIATVIGLIGFVFWQNFVNRPTAKQSDTSVQQTQAPSYATEKKFLNDFYTQYISALDGLNGASQQKVTDSIAKYRVVTKSSAGEFDPVLCAQNSPQTINIDNGIKTTDGISFNIDSHYENSTGHIVAVVGTDNNGMKITVSKCSF